MKLSDLNNLESSKCEQELLKCCGSAKWVKHLSAERPFKSFEDLKEKANRAYSRLVEKDFLEAFSHHPQIGDLDSLKSRFAQTAELSLSEQGDVASSSDQMLKELFDSNRDYLEKNGFIFIVCASGKSAEEMLNILKLRLKSSREDELKVAAEQQREIMILRMEKQFQ